MWLLIHFGRQSLCKSLFVNVHNRVNACAYLQFIASRMNWNTEENEQELEDGRKRFMFFNYCKTKNCKLPIDFGIVRKSRHKVLTKDLYMEGHA